MQSDLQVRKDLAVANRILAHEEVFDAYGHVSVRDPLDPSRFILSRSLSPEQVTLDDLMVFGLDGQPVDDDARPPYLERFIHVGIYAARPDVQAVVHAHTEALLPFSITNVPLRPVIHSASNMGSTVPVWDMADNFGDTDLLVRKPEHGADLAHALGSNVLVLMRGHGFATTGTSILAVVRQSVYLARNARVLTSALVFGEPRYLSEGEVAARTADFDPSAPAYRRGWDNWAIRAGCADLL